MKASCVPQRIRLSDETSRLEALRLLQCDGAIILTEVDPLQAASLPHQLWKLEQLAIPHFNVASVEKSSKALDLHGKAFGPHTDGYVWGDGFPDIIMLACERPADSNEGTNYLLDGHALLEHMEKERPEYAELLKVAAIDHTERSDTGAADGVEAWHPLWRWKNFERTWYPQRLCWRRMTFKTPRGLWKTENDQVKEALSYLDDVIEEQSMAADRFQLRSGEALVVDNFRLLHARDGFDPASNRKLWRVWVWTEACLSVPDAVAKQPNAAAATVLDAGKALREQSSLPVVQQ